MHRNADGVEVAPLDSPVLDLDLIGGKVRAVNIELLPVGSVDIQVDLVDIGVVIEVTEDLIVDLSSEGCHTD